MEETVKNLIQKNWLFINYKIARNKIYNEFSNLGT